MSLGACLKTQDWLEEERWAEKLRTGHKADGHHLWAGILGNAGSGDFGRVEVWGIVLL